MLSFGATCGDASGACADAGSVSMTSLRLVGVKKKRHLLNGAFIFI